VLYAPGSRKKVAERRTGRHPWLPYAPGDTLRIDGRTARIDVIVQRTERRGGDVLHILEIFLRGRAHKRPRLPESNVVLMPRGDDSVVGQFLRYHVLMRVFGGDPDAWLVHLRSRGDADGNLRFVHWVRARLRRDPSFLGTIRRLVDATPFLLSAGAARL
jgi:hypothetical protein